MKRGAKGWNRKHAVEHAERFLLRRGWPRVQMSLALALTGCAGFLVSFTLLRAGVTEMWLRYPLAIIAAYVAFLLLLRFWLYLHDPRGHAGDTGLDAGADIVFDAAGASDSEATSAAVFGGGGDFGGGSAGGSWGDDAVVSTGEGVGGGGSFLNRLDLDVDGGDEGCAALLAVAALAAAVIGGLIASFYVVYVAPVLFAEILVDGLLVTGLYRTLKGVEQRHWLRAAVGRTLLPFILVIVFFTLAGYAMQRAVPEARSIGGFWEGLRSEPPR